MSNPTHPRLMRQRAAQGHIVEAVAQWHRDCRWYARTASIPGMPSDAIVCAENLVLIREHALFLAVGQFLKQF
jgi:hypothetical protein